MINLEEVIKRLGPRAVELQEAEKERDEKALKVISRNNGLAQSPIDRLTALRSWLGWYRVLRGIDGKAQTMVAEAVLNWTDSQTQRSLETLDALVAAHQELSGACRIAYGKPRDFTSLASKALWLRYPSVVPLFDADAERALSVIAKIEEDFTPPARAASKYHRFAYTWRALYDRYASVIEAIDAKNYAYRVRIFDKILWIIGSPDDQYRY